MLKLSKSLSVISILLDPLLASVETLKPILILSTCKVLLLKLISFSKLSLIFFKLVTLIFIVWS
jgi:hypothetical protein